MATLGGPTILPNSPKLEHSDPLLEAGDQLSRDEFERRYALLPEVKKAELIEGTVYMPSPVRARKNAQPPMMLGSWLQIYATETPGTECLADATVRLDLENEPQPD